MQAHGKNTRISRRKGTNRHGLTLAYPETSHFHPSLRNPELAAPNWNNMASLAPYLNFDGNCKEAMEFYAAAFGAEMATMMTFKEMPMEGMKLPPEHEDKIVHASFMVGDGSIMASDIFPGQPFIVGNNNYISIVPDSREHADHLFAELSVGGTIEHSLHDAEWGDYFGSFTDKFGVLWMINLGPSS